jgi:hypothetical protein
MPRVEGSGRKKTEITKQLENTIIREYKGGCTMQNITQRHGITRERQREIYKSHGVAIRDGKTYVSRGEIDRSVQFTEDGLKPIDCNKDGFKKCRYHTEARSCAWKCNYSDIVGHMRGCEPSYCTKWKPKDKKKKGKANTEI